MRWLLLILFFTPSALTAAEEHPMLHHSGLAIPRFVSLKSNEANLRVGPGYDYPIAWVYRKKGLPVEVIEEFGHWRHIRDREGTKGWLHHSLLSGRRSAFILPSKEFTMIPLYAAPDATSRMVMEAEPGAMIYIKQCNGDWCDAEIGDHDGWIAQPLLWGVYENERFED